MAKASFILSRIDYMENYMEDLLQVGVIASMHGIRGEVKVFPTTDDDVEKYKGKSLFVTRENAVKLKKDEYFIADLIGMKVENEDGSFSGTLRDVIVTGANDVYIILCEDGREVMIPAIKECILSVDVINRRIKVHLLDGLLD